MSLALLFQLEHYSSNDKSQGKSEDSSRLNSEKIQVLLSADAGLPFQNFMTKDSLWLKSLSGTKLITNLAHHGSMHSNSIEYFKTLKEYSKELLVFASAGKNNRYGHPSKDLLNQLQQNNIKFFSTPEDGALAFNCIIKNKNIALGLQCFDELQGIEKINQK